MISAPSRSAVSMAISDLPTAVGPARRMAAGPLALSQFLTFHFPLCALRGLDAAGSRQLPIQEQPGNKYPGADQLRGCRPAAEIMNRIIAPERFHKRAQHRIAHNISG